jgi:hypothetical protein
MAGILMTDPGFGRGQTLGVKDATQGTSVTGTQKTFTDTDPRTSNQSQWLSNRPVTCIAVRNTSGGALLPGEAVKFKATAILDEVDGKAASAAAGTLVGIVDEYLPATGVADKDVFWVVVSGPTAIETAASPAAGAALTVTAGKAAAADVAKPAEVIGVAIAAKVGTKVRALVGVKSEHSA